jgi:hypothetical protein
MAMLVPWMICKHHKDFAFKEHQPSICNMCKKIKDEEALWDLVGAKRLRNVSKMCTRKHLFSLEQPVVRAHLASHVFPMRWLALSLRSFLIN